MSFVKMVVIVATFTMLAMGCAQENETKRQPHIPVSPTAHGGVPQAGKSETGMVEAVKKQTLANYASTTVGTAIDSYRYFSKKEWQESRNSKGTFYVDFTGWLDTNTSTPQSIKEGIAGRGVQIKFVIYENGSFGVAMISKVESKTDGRLYVSPLASGDVLDSLYANKPMMF
ncbi:MAG: hypothetical protein ACOYL3_17315 [Desulfuromonadaceae bacterium]